MKHNNGVSITLIVVVVIAVVSLVSVIRNLNNSKKSFREEMALRLDSEEKNSEMEKERGDFLSEIKDLKRSLVKKTEEADSLKKKVLKEQQDKQALDETLKKVQEQLDTLVKSNQQV